MTTINPAQTPVTTLPSGLLVPAGEQPAGAVETTPSGLIVVRNQLSPVTAGSKLVVPTTPISGDGALEAAKSAYAELAASQGEPAAEILLGDQVALAQQVRSDELVQQAIAALLAGDAAAAAQLISQQP